MAKRPKQPVMNGGPSDLEAFDPHSTYMVSTINKNYNGDIGDGKSEIRFRAGLGRLPALSRDASEDELEDRQRLFEFMINAHQGTKRTYVWDEDAGERTERRTSIPSYSWELESTVSSSSEADEDEDSETERAAEAAGAVA